MLVSEMIAEIRDFGFDDLTDTRLLGFLNDTYWDVCTREPWPFLEATASATVDATGLVTSPTDISKVLSISDTVVGTKLQPQRLDDFTQTNATQLTLTGNPDRYYFIGDQLYVYPLSTSNSLTLRYIRIPAALTSTPDATPILPLRHHRVIVLGSLVKCYMMEDDPENAALNISAYEQKIAQMRSDLWFHQYDRPQVIKDLDTDDDWMDWLV